MRFFLIFMLSITCMNSLDINARQTNTGQSINPLFATALTALVIGALGTGAYLAHHQSKKTNSPITENAIIPYTHATPIRKPSKKISNSSSNPIAKIKQKLRMIFDKKGNKEYKIGHQEVTTLIKGQPIEMDMPSKYLELTKKQKKLDLFINEFKGSVASNILFNSQAENQNQGFVNGSLNQLNPTDNGNITPIKDILPNLVRGFRRSDNEFMIIPVLEGFHYNTLLLAKIPGTKKIQAINFDPSNRKQPLSITRFSLEAMDPHQMITLYHFPLDIQRDDINCGPLSLAFSTAMVDHLQKNEIHATSTMNQSDWQEHINLIKKDPIFTPEEGHMKARIALLETFAEDQ
ncbi:MAG: hypothetical protein OXE99_13275 [Cellvibrionales bacterium]|nr:hypothetical protein [Cellvibrionales bacterium]